MPSDFKIDESISKYYHEGCDCKDYYISEITPPRFFHFNVLCSRPAFENLVRAVGLISQGRLDDGDNRKYVELLFEVSKKDLDDVLLSSVKGYFTKSSQELEFLSSRISTVKSALKERYINVAKIQDMEIAKKQRTSLAPVRPYQSKYDFDSYGKYFGKR